MLRIDQDLGRFRDIVKGRVRRELRRYMASGELLGRQGGKVVSVPLPRIGIPHLVHGDNGGGEGEGEGEGGGSGRQAGEASGEHVLEVEISIDELAELLGEELELPRIEPKGTQQTNTVRNRYKGIARQGPESLRHVKRTYRQALRRTLASGVYDPRRPSVILTKDDRRYRSYVPETEPRSAAVILYMMDVSGSMGDQQKEIVRSEAFWIDAWIRHHHRDVATRFVVHDATAREVDRDTFFRTRESGGTLISSAYKLALEILQADYPPEDWNTYVFHFSDGDNWSQADSRLCVELVRGQLLPRVNEFGYGQVDSAYGSGQFYRELVAAFPDDPKVVLSRIADRDGIMDSIRELLGRGN